MTSSGHHPLVTVITPAYNVEAYLRETMDSVQAQTWPNLIHLVIENASTDRTAEILADYENARVPVKVVRHPKLLAQIDNWNSSFGALPDGTEWFRVLCADDTMTPDSVEKMMSVALSEPGVGVVACKVNYGGLLEPSSWPEDRCVFDGREAMKRFFENEGQFRAPHVLINRECIPADGQFFQNDLEAWDTDAVLRVMHDRKFGYAHEYLANTRVHDQSVTALEVEPLRLELLSWFLLLERHADFAFSAQEARAMKRRYRRHYVRRLLNARSRSGGDDIWQEHMRRLEAVGARPGLLDFLDAGFDKFLIALRLRPDWYSYPW